MKVEDIKDSESLAAWLMPRPPADAMAIAHRAALRAIPLWVSAMDRSWAQKADTTALPLLRLNQTSRIASENSTSEVTTAHGLGALQLDYAMTALEDADRLAYWAAKASRNAGMVAHLARLLDNLDNNVEDDRVASLAGSAAHAASVAPHADTIPLFRTAAGFWKQVRRDGKQIEMGRDLLAAPLWAESPPEWFTEHDQKSRAIWAREPETWSFWTRWWDGVLSGNQLDWDLQKEVALIPDDIWQQGPAAIAEAIKKIEERYDLLGRAAALRAELEAITAALAHQASLAQRSHNHPPELVEVAAPVQAQIMVLTKALRETEVELAKPAPDKPLLLRLAATLRDVAATVLRYCGGLADTALQEAAKSVGKSAGLALTVYLTSQGIASLAEAIGSFASKFP